MEQSQPSEYRYPLVSFDYFMKLKEVEMKGCNTIGNQLEDNRNKD